MTSYPAGDHEPIQGILFDFGGVVVDGPFEAFTEIEASSGAPSGLIRTINSRNPDTNAWARLERGEITRNDFVTMFESEAAGFGASIDAAAVFGALVDMPAEERDARPVVLDAIRRHRSTGFRVGLLTNNISPMAAGASGTSWVRNEFDVVVESCLSGMRKPELRFYEAACTALGTDPRCTVFLDDLGINLKPARAFGMHTIKVVQAAAAIAELDGLVSSSP